MKRFLHRLAPLLILAVTAGCCWLLYKQLHEYRWADIRQAWKDMPASALWKAGGLAFLSYVVLVGYDFLAVRSIEQYQGNDGAALFCTFEVAYRARI